MPLTSWSELWLGHMQPGATATGKRTEKKKQRGHPQAFLLPFLPTEQRVKAESAEAARKMLEEMQIKNQQLIEQKEKSYQEHVKQLTEKIEQERAQLVAEQERALTLKLQVLNCVTLRFLFSFPLQSPDLFLWPLDCEAWKDLSCPLILSTPSVCLSWPCLCLVIKNCIWIYITSSCLSV